MVFEMGAIKDKIVCSRMLHCMLNMIYIIITTNYIQSRMNKGEKN